MNKTQKPKRRYKAGNTIVVKTTYKQIINDIWFKKGYESVKFDRPFDYSIDNKQNAWSYERGRLFAKIYNGLLMRYGSVDIEAERALVHAYKAKQII